VTETLELVSALTTPCRQCHVVERATIGRGEADPRTLRNAEFNHRVHTLQRGCLDCYSEIPIAERVGARLLCKRGPMKGAEFEIGDEATIGRSRSNTIMLKSKSISGSHARISWSEDRGSYLVEDLASMNGTELDGVAVCHPEPPGQLHVLTFGKSLDCIFVGDAAPQVSRESERPAGETEDSTNGSEEVQ